ncbi:MAG: acyl-CoA dehydrogenase family protein [Acidimicrobiales bacterium]|nr:acyl-CoA dehydrogenase family protein [Acidimicrobiales bacterium]
MPDPTPDDVRAEVAAWARANWDPALSVADWWRRLADAGWAHPALPEHAGGRGWGRELTQAVLRGLKDAGAIGPPPGLGTMLAAPTIAVHGSAEQIARYIPPILDGSLAWCQLFSEPGAGSDLAGLQTRAVRDGDEWIISGQKVWTSGGQVADMGMLLARTDPDQPKHRGITWFAFDMRQPGVDVRPLREMTGRALFNEVFIDEARAPHDAIIGDLNDGWKVANTTLAVERASLGTGGVSLPSAVAGTIAGHLGRRAGDFASRAGGEGEGAAASANAAGVSQLIALAQQLGRSGEPIVRDALAQLWSLVEINRLNSLRARSGQGRTGGEGNLAKLAMSELFRQFREVGNLVIGADGLLGSDDSGTGGFVQEMTMFSPGPSICGGTDQVQRNIIGERVLGLPKEPGPDRDTPFKALLQN